MTRNFTSQLFMWYYGIPRDGMIGITHKSVHSCYSQKLDIFLFALTIFGLLSFLSWVFTLVLSGTFSRLVLEPCLPVQVTWWPVSFDQESVFTLSTKPCGWNNGGNMRLAKCINTLMMVIIWYKTFTYQGNLWQCQMLLWLLSWVSWPGETCSRFRRRN